MARDEAYFNLGLILRAERRYPEALACLNKAIVLDPRYKLAIAERQDVRGDDAVAADRPASPLAAGAERVGARETGDRARAGVAIPYRYPGDFSGWAVLGDLYAGLALYDRARWAIRRAERLYPRREFACTLWGDFYREKGDFRRSERWYRRAAALRPSVSNVTRLGELQFLQGRLRDAERSFRRAITIAPREASTALYYLGLICRSRRSYRSALRFLDRSIRLNPFYPVARKARQDVLRALRLEAASRAAVRAA